MLEHSEGCLTDYVASMRPRGQTPRMRKELIPFRSPPKGASMRPRGQTPRMQ